MEGQFLKMPNGKEGRNVVRKHSDLSDDKYANIKDDWEKREIRDHAGRIMDLLGKYEVPMTSRQREICMFAIDAVNEVLDEYGVEGSRASICLIKMIKEAYFEKMEIKQATGICLDYLQIVAIRASEKNTDTELADIVFHELIHLFSFQRSVLVGGTQDGYADVRNERMGLAISSKENVDYKYFRYINEAVIAELGVRFWKKIRASDLFKKDLWVLKNKYGNKDKSFTILRMNEKADGKMEPEAVIAYPHEHARTMAMFEHIFEQNKEKFDSPEEVFHFFAKASFSGKLLPIVRLVEKTYGKGAFRSIGEESA